MVTIEERKIALQENRLKLRERKLQLAEKKASKESEVKQEGKRIDPIVATIVVAIIGFVATTVGTIVNNNNVNQLESRKFEFDLIKKGLEQPSQDERVKFLKLISKLKLMKDYDLSKALDSAAEKPEDLPNLSVVPSPIGTEPISFNLNVTQKDYRLGALQAARGEIGQMEDKNAENGGPAVKKYMLGGQGFGWSFGFISWCYSQNLHRQPPFKYNYSGGDLKRELIKNHWWVNKGAKCVVRPGDIYILDMNSGRFHGGIVDSVIDDKQFIGIEGNSNVNGESSGRTVCRRTRAVALMAFGQIN